MEDPSIIMKVVQSDDAPFVDGLAVTRPSRADDCLRVDEADDILVLEPSALLSLLVILWEQSRV